MTISRQERPRAYVIHRSCQGSPSKPGPAVEILSIAVVAVYATSGIYTNVIHCNLLELKSSYGPFSREILVTPPFFCHLNFLEHKNGQSSTGLLSKSVRKRKFLPMPKPIRGGLFERPPLCASLLSMDSADILPIYPWPRNRLWYWRFKLK